MKFVSSRLAAPLRAFLVLASTLLGVEAAHAAPPLPEPPVDPQPVVVPPNVDPTGEPSGPSEPTEPDAPDAPKPRKNPVDILPPDITYMPIGDKHGKAIVWKPEWGRFSTADWVITGAGAALTIGAAIMPPLKRHAYGGVLADESVRNFVRYPTYEGRSIARDGSDIILSLEATWPIFVDSVINAWWYRNSPDAAAQMALIDGEALTLVTALQGITNTIASRERPYGRTCGTTDQPDQTGDCQFNDRYRSFFSGHTAIAFMSASLICVHHTKLDLFGGGAAEALACATAYTGAAATGVFRMVGDKHYLSDVLVGATVGTLVGVSVPLLHYRSRGEAKSGGIDVRVMPVGAGVGVGGSF